MEAPALQLIGSMLPWGGFYDVRGAFLGSLLEGDRCYLGVYMRGSLVIVNPLLPPGKYWIWRDVSCQDRASWKSGVGKGTRRSGKRKKKKNNGLESLLLGSAVGGHMTCLLVLAAFFFFCFFLTC